MFLKLHICQKGTIIAFTNTYKDYNSTFVGNQKVWGGGACYFMSFTKSYFFGSKFYWNYAAIVGGAIGLTQQSLAYVENAVFLSCSAPRGGVISLTEESIAIIKNSNFIGNFANEGGIAHSFENYNATVTISDSTFLNNYGDLNMFNSLDSNYQLFNSQLINNTNTIFSLMSSTLILNGVNIANHSCSTEYRGCIFNGVFASITANNLNMDNINSILEDAAGFYLETSSGSFTNVSFNNLQSIKQIGNCFDLLTSSLLVNFGIFENYQQNCLNAKNSTITINNSYFNNENSFNTFTKLSFSYGTIYCESCLQLILKNSQLLNNHFSYYGGGVSVISNENDFNLSVQFYNVSFVGNLASEFGGAVYISNVQSSFNFCNFTQNKADKGGAIYFYSQGNFSYFAYIFPK